MTESIQPVELDYSQYLDARLADLTTIRHLGKWEVLSATEGVTRLILAVHHDERSVLGCRYAAEKDYVRDLALVRAIPADRGPDGTGAIGALLKPTPPTLSAGDAKRVGDETP